MPLIYLAKQNNGHRIAIWEFENNAYNPLEKELIKTRYSSAIETIKLEKRKREIIGTRLLLDVLNLPIPHYAESGKPLVPQGHISISHGENLVGIAHANFSVGLDLQIPTKKLVRASKKFCNLREKKEVEKSNDPMNLLLKIWSTKEAVFKIYGEHIAFAEGMDVEVLDDWNIKCHVKTNEIDEEILLKYTWINGMILVYNNHIK